MQLELVKNIYRRAIDPTANDGESAQWWADVADELERVIAAPDARAGGAVIAWWHHDWSTVSDSPIAEARRICAAAGRRHGGRTEQRR